MFTTTIFTVVIMGVVVDIESNKLFEKTQKKSSPVPVAVNKSDYQPYFASNTETIDPKVQERLADIDKDKANLKLQQQSIKISTFFEIPETEGMTFVIESLKVSCLLKCRYPSRARPTQAAMRNENLLVKSLVFNSLKHLVFCTGSLGGCHRRGKERFDAHDGGCATG